jgi:hypothetical protein
MMLRRNGKMETHDLIIKISLTGSLGEVAIKSNEILAAINNLGTLVADFPPTAIDIYYTESK